jgi:hypothetical protein
LVHHGIGKVRDFTHRRVGMVRAEHAPYGSLNAMMKNGQDYVKKAA